MEQLRQIYRKFHKTVAFEDQQTLTNCTSPCLMYSKSFYIFPYLILFQQVCSWTHLFSSNFKSLFNNMEQLRQIYRKFYKTVAFEDQQTLTNCTSPCLMYSKSFYIFPYLILFQQVCSWTHLFSVWSNLKKLTVHIPITVCLSDF